MSRSPGARPIRLAGASALVGAGLLLAGCGSSANAAGQTACRRVERSLALYHASLRAPAARAAAERRAALTELRRAMRPAALIGSAGGTWQALAATLEETDRVPESAVASALTAQCAALTTSGG